MSSLIASNKKAFHNYEIIEKIDAGLALKGHEVKSIRAGEIQLKDAFARVINEEVWLFNCYIAPFNKHTQSLIDPTRDRKCLLHKKEYKSLHTRCKPKKLVLVTT